MISLSPKSKFEHRVGMPMPRLTIQPSPNSIASRSHICCRVSPFARSLIVRHSLAAAATILLGGGGILTMRWTKTPAVCTSSGSIAPTGKISSSTSTIVTRAAIAMIGLKLRCERR